MYREAFALVGAKLVDKATIGDCKLAHGRALGCESAEGGIIHTFRHDDAHDGTVAFLALLPIHVIEGLIGGRVVVAFMVVATD